MTSVLVSAAADKPQDELDAINARNAASWQQFVAEHAMRSLSLLSGDSPTFERDALAELLTFLRMVGHGDIVETFYAAMNQKASSKGGVA